MNTTDPNSNITSTSAGGNITASILSASTSSISPSILSASTSSISPSILSASTSSISPSILSASTSSISPSVLQPRPSDMHDPEFTIMVVLGLSLLLAGLAAFLAVYRRSETTLEGDLDRSCAPGERLTRGRGLSSEPQLKTWRRLGSYRRSHNLSFRRPPYRRPHQRDRTRLTRPVASETPQPDPNMKPHITTPCLLDFVTEI